ncbi:hypothetical protein A6X20_38760 [Bradyrhizobium elkanii]|nr:hypothetical protein A6X20_38760 [Bradyrhizobium elkanii]ODM76872.1 hypothetical protein A6452_01560 [Bradyrhizobium elkanii]
MLSLAERHRHRLKIYLDTNFWVMLRRAAAGEGPQMGLDLLAALVNGVESGAWICPLSESAFIELFRQSDLTTRRATAALMDQLSLGLCLIEQNMRMATEIGHLFHEKSGFDIYELDQLVWYRVSYALGYLHPQTDLLSPEMMLALQKGVFDEMWGASLTDIVDQVANHAVPDEADLKVIASNLNRENVAHAHKIRSFKQAYHAEAAGVASLFATVISDIFEQIVTRSGTVPAGVQFIVDDATQNKAVHLVALALEKEVARDTLRSLHILVSLHASLRWDKQRKIDAHDLLDFNHAAAAIAYCDVFLTEEPLRTMVEQRHLGLPERYNCKVRSSLAGALDLIRSI